MNNPEKNEEAVKNEQSREKRRGSQEWTIQRNGQHCPQHTEVDKTKINP